MAIKEYRCQIGRPSASDLPLRTTTLVYYAIFACGYLGRLDL
jgi:hypothetical protein